MRTVYDAANLIDAHLVKHALEDAGIPAFVRGEALTGGIGELGVFGLVAVMVADAAEPEARALIAQLQLGQVAAADGDRQVDADGLPAGDPA
ncbi:DUF2007 domain-containing protein [Thermomonas sp.]|uniref:putative signal transducing protein n=1 Tax=Thermomonas sp. TaxID=1971895 RepID=UPI001AD37E91|nr:DUF2007 domain-containing protein [Xanthomonadales bacterium]MBN8794655.1 DUF2007 domain-containing protein [Stenotrophomonas nitritireducens]